MADLFSARLRHRTFCQTGAPTPRRLVHRPFGTLPLCRLAAFAPWHARWHRYGGLVLRRPAAGGTSPPAASASAILGARTASARRRRILSVAGHEHGAGERI